MNDPWVLDAEIYENDLTFSSVSTWGLPAANQGGKMHLSPSGSTIFITSNREVNGSLGSVYYSIYFEGKWQSFNKIESSIVESYYYNFGSAYASNWNGDRFIIGVGVNSSTFQSYDINNNPVDNLKIMSNKIIFSV